MQDLNSIEKLILQAADDNDEGFVPKTVEIVNCATVEALEKKGYLAYYDACYWITYDGAEALKTSKMRHL